MKKFNVKDSKKDYKEATKTLKRFYKQRYTIQCRVKFNKYHRLKRKRYCYTHAMLFKHIIKALKTCYLRHKQKI